jgi:hypothetical protein
LPFMFTVWFLISAVCWAVRLAIATFAAICIAVME